MSVLRTPLVPAGPGRFLKLECLQPTGSFKVRGFFAEANALPREQLARGIITVSAGNAAQAAAYVAHVKRVPCRTFMFDTAPQPKIDGVKRWGGVPVFMPREALLSWMGDEGWRNEPETFIHPFAGDRLIEAYGQISIELLEDLPDVRRVIVPVGGGGLVSGIGRAMKRLKPSVEVVGVQSSGYAMWPRTFAASKHVALTPDTIADGTAGPFTEKMHRLLGEVVDRWIEVPEKRLRRAVAELATNAKVVAEGAGALAYAAFDQLHDDAPTVAIVSGGNIDPALLAELLTARIAPD